ncbi:MAG: hypothetical protein ABIB43_05340 [archaeon]
MKIIDVKNAVILIIRANVANVVPPNLLGSEWINFKDLIARNIEINDKPMLNKGIKKPKLIMKANFA